MFGHMVNFSAFRRLSQSRACVCARQSPLACPEASLPNLHGSVIAKFKQWPRGDHSTTPYPQTRQSTKKSKFCLYCGPHQNAVRERKEWRQARLVKTRQDKPERVTQGGGLMNTRSMYPFAGLPSNWKQRRFRVREPC